MKRKWGKVVITGGKGANGFETALNLMCLRGFVTELVVLVRKPEDIDTLIKRTRVRLEREPRRNWLIPMFTTDPKMTCGAHIWINWKGAKIEDLLKANPGLEAEYRAKGLSLRNIMLANNLPISVADAQLALKYAPDCIYLQEGNPVDSLVRIVNRLGFKPGRVISTGVMPDYDRIVKLLTLAFSQINLENLSGLCIGEHGDKLVIAKSRFMLNGASLEEIVRTVEPNDPTIGSKRLDEVFGQIAAEGKWVREASGRTAYEGPAANCRDLVMAILSPKSSFMSVSSYIRSDDFFGINDTALSLSARLGCNGVEEIIHTKLNDAETQELKECVAALTIMNRTADELFSKL